METVANQLSGAWMSEGHEVQVVTQTPLRGNDEVNELQVTRQPSVRTWSDLLSWADLFVQSGVSLRSLPFTILTQTPVVFIHHNMLPVTADTVGLRNALKRAASRLGRNVAVSTAVANDLPTQTTVIHNPFEPHFKISRNEPVQDAHLLFVGRLVTVKGADVAIRALTHLPKHSTLTICGDGNERSQLETLAETLGVRERTTFCGWVDHKQLADIARDASVQLVPSRYEPFGIVALEGIAAGCSIVASNTGGLPEAVGPCGILVDPGDPKALAVGVREAIQNRSKLLAQREQHLSSFHIDKIAKQYLSVFRDAVQTANT
jgi:glycosyltransferase involved in cell wall biosynthesis